MVAQSSVAAAGTGSPQYDGDRMMWLPWDCELTELTAREGGQQNAEGDGGPQTDVVDQREWRQECPVKVLKNQRSGENDWNACGFA